MTHIEREHSITLAAPIDRVFPLFTPLGETRWVPGWAPDFLHPASGETCEGMVFRTAHGAEETLWSCIHWTPDDYRVRYVRVTPGVRFGFVSVAGRALEAGQAEINVGYTFTALGAEGEAMLAALTQEAFAAMIDGWQIALNRLLAEGLA
jgi:hypothetical protein